MSISAFDHKTFLATLPNLPGVYRMMSAEGTVIYVGKARELKQRVSSYFLKTLASPRTAIMVSQIATIETTITGSEAEALLLENNLIKSLAPKYNIVFRDDKSYPYLMVTAHAFPQIRFYRGTQTKPHRYYGPFPNSWAVREALGQLQRVFKLRTCDDTVYANRSRPCLLYQIGRCTAPCVGKISQDAYAEDIRNAELFLEGRENLVIKTITENMEVASAALAFEQAALFRDQIRLLQAVTSRQYMESASERDVDVIAAVEEGGIWCVTLAMVRGGRHLGDKSLFPQNSRDADVVSVLDAFLEQHYANQKPPATVVVDGVDLPDAQIMLSDIAGRAVRVVSRPIGEARVWMSLAVKNARHAVQQRQNERSTQALKLQAMRDVLELSGMNRVECFDISHTMGEATVASCVVFDRGDMQPTEYRRFNIAGITPGDDYAAMRDVLTRRYRKLAASMEPERDVPQPDEAQPTEPVSHAPPPDLILIDGGKGQLSVAEEVMNELGLNHLVIIGVAKGEERKPGLETLIWGGTRQELHLPMDNPGFHLIQHIRDEAHRFAITGHRARRAKKRNTSRLEEIADIGPKRRRALLTHFGGLQEIVAASVEDLTKVEGISQKLAEAIYNQLH